MTTTRTTRTTRTSRSLVAVGLLAVLTLSACSDGDATAADPPDARRRRPPRRRGRPIPAEGPPTPPRRSPTSSPRSPRCATPRGTPGLPSSDGTLETVDETLAFLDQVSASGPALDALEVPPSLAPDFDLVVEAAGSASDELDAAHDAAAAGDVALADRHIARHIAHLRSGSGRFALMGLECGFAWPDRAAAADLSIPLDLHAEQINLGFGSVWVSQKVGDDVVRLDPDTGEVLATIDVGVEPLKLQPADGRMWVRTADAYVAIDPETDAVTATLAKADVGPDANRNFAFDDSMWICDGRRLHRYDLATLERVATIDLDIECTFVQATTDLVVAWNLNTDPGESGQSATAMIDPATDEVLATIDLPVDVVWPVVFDDTVFFGGQMNSSAVVIDRDTWTVSSTVELPDVVGGGGISTDGTSIFVPTRGEEPWEVIVLDAEYVRGRRHHRADRRQQRGRRGRCVVGDGSLHERRAALRGPAMTSPRLDPSGGGPWI